MKFQKARTAAIAVSVATAIALSGTFAWQSISPMALNEAKEPTNPGGRLHDDFSGYGPNETKDIYVENFGNEPIYARVRLDEYMEIGEGAGLKGAVGAPNPGNHAESLVVGAKIDDLTTWTTHIPGATGAETGEGTEAPDWNDAAKTFHTYWTWTMGGQAEDNPNGKTVYMPTFNKNKDSLKADINGTLAGKDGDPDAGDPYDDYHPYALGDPADTRVRDTNTLYDGGAAYDADENTADECGPYGGAGSSGVAGTNYEMKAESHNAQETMNASVITMAEYKVKSDADKADFLGWVYDVDGWAYWSQPIAPGTPTETDKYITNATGLLLDRIALSHKPSEAWYYGVNAVGQFITADDLGRSDDPKTGFYAEGAEPTEDALDLLDGIGVNTAAVKGSIRPSASVTVGGTVNHLSYAVQGMSIDLAAVVTVPSATPTVQTVTWKVTGNSNSTGTYIDDSTGTPVLHVAGDETGPLTLTATSTAYDHLKGKLKLPVHPLTYTVTVTPDGGATSVLPGKTQNFTAKLTRNDFQTIPTDDQTFTWALDTTGVTYKSGTSIAPASDTSKATLTVAGNETGPVTVKATPTNAAYSSLSGTASIAVTPVTYTVDIKDSAGNKVTGTTVEARIGYSYDFTVAVESAPAGVTPTDNWTWSSSDTTGKITVDTNGKVFAGSTVGQTATITATNNDYNPALEASFTITAVLPTPANTDVGHEVAVDGVYYTVLLKDVTVNGKAAGEETASDHKAALLLATQTQGAKTTFGSSYSWKDSDIRAYLNSTASGKWLNGKTETKSKAITVTLQTRKQFNDSTPVPTEDTVFLLSSADVCGQYHNGSEWVNCESWEYTYGTSQLTCFKAGDAIDPNRVARDSSGTAQPWWLRSPSHKSDCVAIIGTGGNVVESYVNSCGVRPAFWYNLDT